MIKTITVTNHVGDSLVLELTKPEASGFLVKSVSGLGPVKANINVTDIATSDGGIYNSARAETRNIVFNLHFMGLSIEDVRHKCYTFFPLKKRIEIVIETDNRRLGTYGYVESNEPDIFSEQEGAQISVICPESYFSLVNADGGQVTNFSSIEPLFHFPFQNEGLTTKTLVFSEIKVAAVKSIWYEGDADTGFEIRVNIHGQFSAFFFTNAKDKTSISFDENVMYKILEKAFGAGNSTPKDGDYIIISTVFGDKRIEYWRDGVKVNLMNALYRNSVWPTLTVGENRFQYSLGSGADNIDVTVSNRVLYVGV